MPDSDDDGASGGGSLGVNNVFGVADAMDLVLGAGAQAAAAHLTAGGGSDAPVDASFDNLLMVGSLAGTSHDKGVATAMNFVVRSLLLLQHWP